MSIIHKHSHGVPLPEFDLFTVPPTQISVSRDIETEHRPNFPIKDGARELVYEFSTPEHEYVNMRETEVFIRLRFRTAAANWTFTPELSFLDTLIESIDIWINDKLVTHSTSTYPWRAALCKYLNYTPQANSGHVTAGMCDQKGLLWMPVDKKVTHGPWFELRGKIFSDLAMQNRAILGGCKFKITLRLNKREFVFRYPAESASTTGGVSGATTPSTPPMDVEYEISEASLLVHRACVTPQTLVAHKHALAKATAKYPINRVEIKQITIPAGINDIKTESIFTGQLPRRVMVLFMASDSSLGKFTAGPFDFGHFNLNYIAFDIDGVEFPRNGYTPDFANNLFMREYYSFMQSINADNPDSLISIPLTKWVNRPIFAYNFAPDLSGGCDFGHINKINHGSMGLRLRFATTPVYPLKALIHAEFDNLIEIDQKGVVSTDYM